MHKVVVERPRWNPGPAKYGRRANLPDELQPKFEGIKRPYQKRKGLTDLLGPLERWLHAQVGRPWNDVYSEACAVIKPDSIIRQHIKTHLLEFVERHTFMHGGKVCVIHPYGRNRGITPVAELTHRRTLFYVHPETFLLCKMLTRALRRWNYPDKEHRALTQRWLNGPILLRQLSGCWFSCNMKAFPRRTLRGDSPWRYDFAEKKLVCRADANKIYGGPVYCTGKRQLSRRELLEAGLSNNSQAERSLQPVIVMAG